MASRAALFKTSASRLSSSAIDNKALPAYSALSQCRGDRRRSCLRWCARPHRKLDPIAFSASGPRQLAARRALVFLLVQPFEQPLSVAQVASLTGIISAERPSTQDCAPRGRNFLALELFQITLVSPSATDSALRRHSAGCEPERYQVDDGRYEDAQRCNWRIKCSWDHCWHGWLSAARISVPVKHAAAPFRPLFRLPTIVTSRRTQTDISAPLESEAPAVSSLESSTGREPTSTCIYLNFETRSACSRITRALSSVRVPVGSPL